MNAGTLLVLLYEAGVKLSLKSGELHISAPKGALTDELRSALQQHKEEILELLIVSAAGDTRNETAIEAAPRDQPLPLSFAQQRLWILDELDPGTPVYNIPWIIGIKESIDTPVLQQALNTLVKRHEILRTRFVVENDEPRQKIAAELSVPLEHIDMRGTDDDALRDKLRELARIPFDLKSLPLIRVYLVAQAPDRHVLLIVIHHIVSDAWSLDVMLRDLVTFFTAYQSGTEAILPELPLQFVDYAVWQRDFLSGQELQEQLNYWTRQLDNAPAVLELPTDHPRPVVQTVNGARVSRYLSRELNAALKALAASQQATDFMVLLAAFNVLLARYTGQDDIVVGSPIAGRQRTEFEALIGLFVNTLVLRNDLSGNPSFRSLLDRVRDTAMDAYEHQDLPFERLVDQLRPVRDRSRSPVFQVLFMSQKLAAEDRKFGDLNLFPFNFDNGTAKFDLTCATGDTELGLAIELEYNTDLFAAATMERMLDHFEILLEGIVANPDSRLSELPLLSDAERHQMLVEWNNSRLDLPVAQTLHGFFEQQVAARPEAIALWHDGQTLTYAELNRRANILALRLGELGIGPEVLVGVCLERRSELIVALLAVLKAGGAYVPIDPNYPQQRIAFILQDTLAPVLLTQSWLVERLPEHAAQLINLDQFDFGAATPANPQSGVRADHLAYTIYTSGSTGQPKGVEIEHRNAVALMAWAGQTFGADELDGVLASTSVCFDLSVFEIFAPLGLGGRLVLVEDGLALSQLPEDADVRIINTVPSVIAELVHAGALPASVATVNLAGEPLSTTLVNEIYDLGTVARVNDLYGPTEDTTYSTWTWRERDVPPSIGRPISNTQVYLLDAYGQPVPQGVPGELYLGGAGVSRGYRNQEALTAQHYVSDPFSAEDNARLYRTGDRARYRPDGTLEFLGRLDHQIKLRGLRIELGEIESVLETLAGIDAAVVIMREDTPGDKRLVAYCVSSDGSFNHADLRSGLRAALPIYMIPGAFVELQTLPLTPNGKIDRNMLPAPEWRADEDEFVVPRTPNEKALAKVWINMLRVERVGIHDDFFMLGGTSMQAIKLIQKLKDATGSRLTIADVFDHPTIGELAPLLEGADLSALATESGLARLALAIRRLLPG